MTHNAMRSFISGKTDLAKQQYADAVSAAKTTGIDLTSEAFYKNVWKAGPKEMEIAGALIKLIRDDVTLSRAQ